MNNHSLVNKRAARRVSAFTLMLSRTRDPHVLGQAITLAYHQLRTIAHQQIRQETPGRTLQPTDLVHEVCHRFLKRPQNFKNRAYFFSAATRAMRRLLVETARRRQAKKRGGDWVRVDFSYAERLGFESPRDLLTFNRALTDLQHEHPKLGLVAQWRVFSGLAPSEISRELQISVATERARWLKARKWLQNALAENKRPS